MKLSYALRLSSAPRLALVGAGGKTAALFQLAREFASPVLVTTTTHLSVEQAQLGDRHFIVEAPEQIDGLHASQVQGVSVISGPPDSSGRLAGLAAPVLERLLRLADDLSVPLLIEADGARQLSRESPCRSRARYSTLCRYRGCPGRLIRPGQAALPADSPPSRSLCPLIRPFLRRCDRRRARSRRVLLHPEGGLKGIPPGARRILLLNQADTDALQSQAQAMLLPRQGQPALFPAYHAVVIASLVQQHIFAVHEPVAGIILAAGGASRFGAPKQLLTYEGVARSSGAWRRSPWRPA